MNKQTFFTIVIVFLFSLNFVSAISVSDVSQEELFSGETVQLKIDLKNNLDEDVEDVFFNLRFENVPFISIGASGKSYDEFNDGDVKSFSINVKSSQNIEPGDYSVPYVLSYVNLNGDKTEKEGSIGIVVGAKTELNFNVELDTNIIGEQGKVSLKIINKGFGEIKFVNVKIIPEGFTIIGKDSDYIGSIDSDDFESATFDVLFNKKNAKAVIIVTYKDFNNIEQVETIQENLEILSREEGIQRGIIQKDNTFIYVVSIIILIVLWLIYRRLKKRLKKKNRA